MPESTAGLDGRLGRVEGLLQALLSTQNEEVRNASESRSRLYLAIEELRGEIRAIAHDQASITGRLAEIEETLDKRVLPVIRRAEKLEHQAQGARWAGLHAWTAFKVGAWPVVVFLAAFWRELVTVVRSHLGL